MDAWRASLALYFLLGVKRKNYKTFGQVLGRAAAAFNTRRILCVRPLLRAPEALGACLRERQAWGGAGEVARKGEERL